MHRKERELRLTPHYLIAHGRALQALEAARSNFEGAVEAETRAVCELDEWIGELFDLEQEAAS
jgi:hypothetical protein